MKMHELKILPPYFDDICWKKKTFEVRKNDRHYEVGDYLILREFDNHVVYTGNFCLCKVVYLLDNPEFVKDGYVILGIQLLDKENGLPF